MYSLLSVLCKFNIPNRSVWGNSRGVNMNMLLALGGNDSAGYSYM